MSRCFPYPPPGYTPPSRASNDALIESIKLQRGREKVKAERNREKKERKRDKKEKKKAKEGKATKPPIKDVHLDHDAHHPGESLGYVKAEIHQKGRKDDIEQLERSSITEEHEQPISLQNPSYSSDSTQNSSKRKRHASPPPNGTRVQGNILRIRLPSQKLIKRDVRDVVQQPCSTSGRTDVPAEHKIDTTRTDADKLCSTSTAVDLTVNDRPLRSDHGLALPQSVEQNDVDTHLENVHPDYGSKRYKKMNRAEERYRDLILNWTPPDVNILRETIDCGDKDWWMGKRNEVNRPEKNMLGVSKEIACSSSSSSWPRAHYLPDVDIYALPYAVPF